MPSQEQVATFDGSTGCQIAEMHTWSWHLSFRKTFPDFQSQNHSRPSQSPDGNYVMSGETPGWHA